ncbi:hypothetical protein TNCV_4306651 [Trichonephila clavipes]|nr:hypothetical protein TNCV_4306651 [Trichonephila clavipes]
MQTCITCTAVQIVTAVRTYHVRFLDRRMPHNRIFQRVNGELHEIRSFHVTRQDAGQRRAVSIPSLDKSILNVLADRPKNCSSSIKCESSDRLVLKYENRLHLFHFLQVQAFNTADSPLRLLRVGTAKRTAAGLPSSCAEQL